MGLHWTIYFFVYLILVNFWRAIYYFPIKYDKTLLALMKCKKSMNGYPNASKTLDSTDNNYTLTKSKITMSRENLPLVVSPKLIMSFLLDSHFCCLNIYASARYLYNQLQQKFRSYLILFYYRCDRNRWHYQGNQDFEGSGLNRRTLWRFKIPTTLFLPDRQRWRPTTTHTMP